MKILIVDDEAAIRRMLRRLLEGKGHEVTEAPDAAAALARARTHAPDAILLDLQLPDRSGLDIIPELAAAAPAARIVMMTAHGSIPSAVRAMREGAWDYLTKPFDNDDLLARLRHVGEVRRLEDEVVALRRELAARYGLDELVGTSAGMAEVFRTISKVGPLDATVLILGETGTGKELIARAIHRASERRAGPFVPVNCGAIPSGLVEDAFFGHVRGAFTGADRDRRGFFEQANGGTLFLDEIAELPGEAQASLLRVLQDHHVTRVGDSRQRGVDARIIAATNVELEQATQAGTFREDLYWRLSGITIRIPPLRERRDDIPALARHLLARHAAQLGIAARRLEPAAVEILCRSAWPGNIRQLENTLYRALVMAEGDTIGVRDLPVGLTGGVTETGEDERHLEAIVGELVSRVEAAEIRDRLESHRYNRTATAASLGISRKTLFNKMRLYGIVAPDACEESE